MLQSRAWMLLVGIVAIFAIGCQSPSGSAAPSARPTPSPAPLAMVRPVAYVNSVPVSRDELWAGMVEAGGGAVIEEIVLDRLLADRLQRLGHTLTDSQINAEREALLATLDPDPDQAMRLLNELRQTRGLGDDRFARLLRRNAALRHLSTADLDVGEAAIRQAFEVEYGPRYEGRIIVVQTLQEASEVVRRARAGESFIDLAIARSIDASRAQGGLLDPINPADATYPQAIRTVISGLEPGGVSDPVSIESGFAVLKLERKIEAQPVRLDDVRDALTLRVRRQMERIRMQQLARTMLSQADVVVFDGGLQKQWNVRRQQWRAE
jgi:parvulin-like peptidyl-prolyl isomerase